MGSAIECFDDASAVVVPRSRFAPVKTCSDLFALRSGRRAVFAARRSCLGRLRAVELFSPMLGCSACLAGNECLSASLLNAHDSLACSLQTRTA